MGRQLQVGGAHLLRIGAPRAHWRRGARAGHAMGTPALFLPGTRLGSRVPVSSTPNTGISPPGGKGVKSWATAQERAAPPRVVSSPSGAPPGAARSAHEGRASQVEARRPVQPAAARACPVPSPPQGPLDTKGPVALREPEALEEGLRAEQGPVHTPPNPGGLNPNCIPTMLAMSSLVMDWCLSELKRAPGSNVAFASTVHFRTYNPRDNGNYRHTPQKQSFSLGSTPSGDLSYDSRYSEESLLPSRMQGLSPIWLGSREPDLGVSSFLGGQMTRDSWLSRPQGTPVELILMGRC